MASTHDTSLDRDLSFITNQLGGFSLKEGTEDDKSLIDQTLSTSDNSVLFEDDNKSFSTTLDPRVLNSSPSVLEKYKDIINGKIQKKISPESKLPLSTSSIKLNLHSFNQDSNHFLNSNVDSNAGTSATKPVSRVVSDSPSHFKSVPAMNTPDRVNEKHIPLTRSTSMLHKPYSSSKHVTRFASNVHGRSPQSINDIASSSSLSSSSSSAKFVSARLEPAPATKFNHEYRLNNVSLATPESKKANTIPSYLKQTTSSSKKTNCNNVKENKENKSILQETPLKNRIPSHGFSRSKNYNKPRIHSMILTPSQSIPSQMSVLGGPAESKHNNSHINRQDISTETSSKQAIKTLNSLNIAKTRTPIKNTPNTIKRLSFVQPRTQYHDNSIINSRRVSRDVVALTKNGSLSRSYTHQNLSDTATSQRKISAKTASIIVDSQQDINVGASKRESSRNPSNVYKARSASLYTKSKRNSLIFTSQKISSIEDLTKLVTKSSLAKECEILKRKRVERVEPIIPENMKDHSNLYDPLNNYEKSEVLRKRNIYFTGKHHLNKPNIEVLDAKNNFGFDDNNKNYIIRLGDHINYRYEILKILGNGAFGGVIACRDYKDGKVVAMKIVKNEMTCSLQAVNEVKILKKIAISSHHTDIPMIRYFNHFHFRGHMCISTEYLPINLFQVLELAHFKGFEISIVANFAKQLLTSLEFLHENLQLVHCDLKPENIMLTSLDSFNIKLIDFGSSCHVNEVSYSYIQSRFYRAPEVLLGGWYSEKIDIWSLGVILVELFTGSPVFPCKTENELMQMMVELIGAPNENYIIKLRLELLAKGSVGSENSEDKDADLNTSTLLWKIFNEEGCLNLSKLQKKLGILSFIYTQKLVN
ncbi:hypothetical protein PACTADRAFT_51327 [Pachysolen tannophilus NRRL Y-2460]|uniref:Protein kinase domain-containing protein n=1 Tax=Pachysolen tannophilus NRRL Y-2460 TaxID=669874 RepID=A0A1E4TRV8_PACTA|nr:hypothetical protein PACTADRAFT_51327 [Pachysolen tannophilus NRRL Y-2460]